MKISVIGPGHLGKCLIKGLLRSGISGDDISVYARRDEVCSEVADNFGVFASSSLGDVVSRGEVIFIVIKSAGFEELFASLPSGALNGRVCVSFMAGVGLERLSAALPGAEVVCAMPSIAIESCSGITAYTSCPDAVADIFRSLGYAFEVAPDGIGRVMAFASCGVGFAAYLMDAYVKAGISMGFSVEESRKITAITFQNALECGDFAKTVTAVATKGGATEQGVLHMENAKLPETVYDAIMAAFNRMK